MAEGVIKVGGARKRKALLLDKLKRQKIKRKIRTEKEDNSTTSPVINLEFPDEEERAVQEFRAWCDHVTIKLHPQLFIGRHGSCHEIGVRARETISRGEVIARLPRSSLLTADNSHLNQKIQNCKAMSSSGNTWLPLLAALIGEYSLKGRSYWQPYLNLVPNNRGCPPPILWSKGEREELLGGTGLYQLVKHDSARLENDYKSIVEPFLIQSCVDKSFYSLQQFTQVAAFVMSYSFTDSQNDSFLSHTMMIPFVDLLNHHTQHHVELNYKKNHLELVAVREIHKGEEIMNTFGQLPNYSLLHTHGFVEINNKVDKACVPLCHLHEVYLSSQFKTLKWRKKRWKKLLDNEFFDQVYEVNQRGVPEKRLIKIMKMLMTDGEVLPSPCQVSLSSLTHDEFVMLKRYIENSIAHLPCSSSLTSHHLCEKEKDYVKYALQMCQEHLIYLNLLLDNIASLSQ